ncbi:MAG: ArgE/DapE family deacylase [Chloroflexota bacterium]
MIISVVEQRVLDAIDFEAMLAYICELVAIRSLDGEETAVQQNVANKMRKLGLEVDTWDLDFAALSQHPSFCVEVEREHGLGVVGIMGGDQGRSLILNGHTDVVPAGEAANWTYPAWEGTIANGNVYGRGALDMKGGLCCALFAAKAIMDAGVSLKGKLMIESVIGEEDGGVGTLGAIARGYRADAAVIMEPTELMIAPAQAGALNFRVTIPGYAAHGAVRTEGVSAIEKFVPIYAALMALEKQQNEAFNDPYFAAYDLPYPLCVGTIQAGNWASTVAESLTFEGRFGIAVGQDVAAARQLLEETVAKAAAADPWLRDNPPTVEWWGGQFAPARIDEDEAIVTAVSAAFENITHTPARIQGMTYGADMRLLVNDGNTPTLMFGPGDVRNAHQPDEFVPIADLETMTKTLVLTILRFCEHE